MNFSENKLFDETTINEFEFFRIVTNFNQPFKFLVVSFFDNTIGFVKKFEKTKFVFVDMQTIYYNLELSST